ncbi:hypothetical protein [Mesorhizobium marinum]|uniref:hypothetical protein n=1 Tax=Mesorhizobium marinum TaxID=3228790 RepID=UPI0034672174
MRQADVARWAQENGTDPAALERMLADNARVATLARASEADLRRGILDRLRERDLYAICRDRAQARQRHAQSPSPARPPDALLAAWHFEKRLGRPVPEDLAEHAASLGLASVGKFFELVALDYTFQAAGAQENDTGAADETSIA